MPAWIVSGTAGTPDEATFRAGAALACLHPVATGQVAGLPLALLRDRMALAAAAACIARAGGRARAAELRDRMAFLAPDAGRDPDTALLALWRRAGATGLRGDALARLLPEGVAEAQTGLPGTGGGPDGDGGDKAGGDGDGADMGKDGRGSEEGARGHRSGDPVAQAVRVIERLRGTSPEQGPAGLMLADATLARALGWTHLLPLLSTGLARRDLALDGAALRRACYGAITREAIRALRLAADLERRAARLRAVAPKLRARASGAAVALFLARDAVAPSMDLTPHVRGSRTRMSPRAASRLCDRLVELGAVRELTGRATFRLYGL